MEPRAKRVQGTDKGDSISMEKQATEEATTSKIEVPFDIALSLLEPDELEKLKKYVIAYLSEYPEG